MHRSMKMMAVAAGLLLGAAGSAQGQEITGTYAWEMPVRVRAGSDGTSSGEGGSAQVKLVLEVRGDSVFGTYTVQPPPGQADTVAPQAREIRGTISGNRVTWVMSTNGRVNINGNARETTMLSTYIATIEGDDISVTIDVEAPDMPMQVPQRSFKGKRVS